MLSVQKQVQADLEALMQVQGEAKTMRQLLYKHPAMDSLKKAIKYPDKACIVEWWYMVRDNEEFMVALQKILSSTHEGLKSVMIAVNHNAKIQSLHRLEAAIIMQSLASGKVTTYQGLKKHFSKNYKSN